MEFRFNVNDVFKTPIVEIGSNLVPPGFQGDRRQLWEAVTKVSEVINTIGEASAAAQGLTKPITTSERLRNAENQRLYLLIDRNAKTGKGCVTGMLKTGKKGLYVFDRLGQHYQVQPNCILDFYIHESRQRTGLGKHLFEHMLQKEEVDPVKLAIDRPSDKFLAFLKKHYNLDAAIRQMNNYVVFEGFFPEEEKLMAQQQSANSNTDSPTNRMTTRIHLDKRGSNGLQQQAITSPYGRYGAPRPPCLMAQIIHNQSAVVGAQEPVGCSLNMTPSKDRSAYTLRRASRHSANEEMRRQYYAPPRLPFNPCPAVGNGLGDAAIPDCSPALQESNIQLVTREQMLRIVSEQQQKQQMNFERPQSILQNLPSPTFTKKVCSSPSATASINNNNASTLVQQNLKVLDGSQSHLIRSPSGLRCYHTLPANQQPSDMRIVRPKPLITDPLKDYSKIPTVSVDLQQTMQYVQFNQQQQQYAQQVNSHQHPQGDSQDSPRTFHWQNQIYQSRDAPTNYPFVSDQRNPNKFYVSHEESGESIKQQQDAAPVEQLLPNQQQQQQQQQQVMVKPQDPIPASFNSVDQISKRSKNTEQKVFPNDFQQQNVQPHHPITPPSDGQPYQLNSHNINPPNFNAYPQVDEQANLYQQQQQKYNMSAFNGTSHPNLYQPLPTITEIESEQAISAKKESMPKISEDYAQHRPAQQSISKFTLNQNTERRPLQEISPRSNENVRLEQNYAAQPLVSPRYNQNNVSSAVTSQNVGNFEAQSPRLNQYLVQQQQQYQQPEQKINVEYNPRPRQECAHIRPLSSHPAVMQNIGNFEQQTPRLNLTIPLNVPKEEFGYPSPPTVEQLKQEAHHQKPSPRSSNGLLHVQEQRQPTEPNKSPSPRHYPYSMNNPVHKSPINHLEYNYTPITSTPSKTTCEHTMIVPPNDKSEQVKPNCLPERTPRLNSAQASASTQINIPKNMVGPVAQAISPGYNSLETESYKNLQSQAAVGGQGRWDQQQQQQQQQRDVRYDHHCEPKPDKYHVPNMKGDMVANSLSGGQLSQRPAEIRDSNQTFDQQHDDGPQEEPIKFMHTSEKLERPRSLSLHTNDDEQFIANGTKNLHIAEEPTQKKLEIHSLDAGIAKKTTPSHLTDQGYFDLKFYHNKLW